jgi:hypothetical protein
LGLELTVHTTWDAACQQVGTISCHTSGFVPIDPSSGACQSDGGVFDYTTVCTADGGVL